VRKQDANGFRRPQVEAAYEKHVRENHGEVIVPILCEAMWTAGGREAIIAMESMAGVIRTFRNGELELRRMRRIIQPYFTDESVEESED
jgi:hypothetical protein